MRFNCLFLLSFYFIFLVGESNANNLSYEIKYFYLTTEIEQNEVPQVLDQDFISQDLSIPLFGYTHKKIGARIDLVSNFDTNIYLLFESPIEEIYGKLEINGQIVQTDADGMLIPPTQNKQKIITNFPSLFFNIPKGNSRIYLKEVAVAPHFPLTIYTEEELSQKKHINFQDLFMFGIFTSILIFLIITFLYLKDLNSLFLITATVSFFILNGFVIGEFRFIFTLLDYFLGIKANFLFTLNKFWPISMVIYLLSISIYSLNMIGLKKISADKKIKLFTGISIAGQFLLGFVSLFDIPIAMNSFAFSFWILIFLLCYLSVKQIQFGNRNYFYLLLGWIIMGLLSLTELLYYFGIQLVTFKVQSYGSIYGHYGLITFFIIFLFKENNRKLVHLTDTNAKLGIKSQIIHDLKSPILAMKSILSDNEKLDDNALNILKTAFKRVDAIIDDLKTEKKKEIKSYLLKEIIDEILIEKNNQYQQSGIIFNLNFPQELMASLINVNKSNFLRVLSNLINNAVESYSNPQGKKIDIAISHNKKTISISIKDYGKGIPAEVLKKIGKLGVSVGKEEGSGLGLHHAISEVRSYGGNIKIESQINKGTLILLYLPNS